jgi:predicted DNA-binding transcriptional regulator AlpA
MKERALYSISEARELLGGISRNSIYALLRDGRLPSVVLGCRRFVSGAAITQLIDRSTTTVSPAIDHSRSRHSAQQMLPLPLPDTSRRRRARTEA